MTIGDVAVPARRAMTSCQEWTLLLGRLWIHAGRTLTASGLRGAGRPGPTGNSPSPRYSPPSPALLSSLRRTASAARLPAACRGWPRLEPAWPRYGAAGLRDRRLDHRVDHRACSRLTTRHSPSASTPSPPTTASSSIPFDLAPLLPSDAVARARPWSARRISYRAGSSVLLILRAVAAVGAPGSGAAGALGHAPSPSPSSRCTGSVATGACPARPPLLPQMW